MSNTPSVKNLLSRSTELIDKMKRIDSRAADEVLVKKMEEIEKPLQGHAVTIVKLRQSLALLQKANLCEAKPIGASTLKPLQDRISKLRKRLNENRSQIAQGSVWAECNALAEKHGKDLAQQLQKQWEDFIVELTPGIETFRPFKDLESCKAKFVELEKLDRESKSVQGSLPLADTEMEAVRSRGQRMHELISGLGLEGEPPEMQEFLKRCAQNGVALEELTGEVLAWLVGKGFAASLRIVTR